MTIEEKAVSKIEELNQMIAELQKENARLKELLHDTFKDESIDKSDSE